MERSSARCLPAAQGMPVLVYHFNEAVADGHTLVLSSCNTYLLSIYTRKDLFL